VEQTKILKSGEHSVMNNAPAAKEQYKAKQAITKRSEDILPMRSLAQNELDSAKSQ